MSTKNKVNGIKYLITSASLVTTIGLWNYFSSQAEINKQALQKMEPDPQISNVHKLEFAPLPTLFPGSNTALSNYQQQDSYEILPEEADLREVQRPEAELRATPQVTINQVIIGQAGGNTLNNPPINDTGSSK